MNTIDLNKFNKIQQELSAKYGSDISLNELDELTYEEYKRRHTKPSLKPDYKCIMQATIAGQVISFWQVVDDPRVVSINYLRHAVLKVNDRTLDSGKAELMESYYNKLTQSMRNPHSTRRRKKNKTAS